MSMLKGENQAYYYEHTCYFRLCKDLASCLTSSGQHFIYFLDENELLIVGEFRMPVSFVK